MKVLVRNVPYNNLVLDVTGAELETIAKAFAGAIQVKEEYLNHEYRKVEKSDPVKIEMTIFRDQILTQAQVDEIAAEAGPEVA